jgi:aspartate racemase
LKKTIGILGGIGPESSAKFYQDLINELQNRNIIKSNEDYPHIILNSIPAPELVNNDNLNMYLEGIKTLEKSGADFIVIICNTAYLYFEELQKTVKIPIIDLKKEIKKYLDNEKNNEILVLGSKKTKDSNIFEFKGIKISDDDKNIIDDIIINYNIGKDREIQKDILLRIIKKYKSKTLLLACTELSLLLKDIDTSKIDTMEILLDATIREWHNSKVL